MGTELDAVDVMAVYFMAVAFGGAAMVLLATGVAIGVRRALLAFRGLDRIRAASSAR